VGGYSDWGGDNVVRHGDGEPIISTGQGKGDYSNKEGIMVRYTLYKLSRSYRAKRLALLLEETSAS